jgi:hypothetical protein
MRYLANLLLALCGVGCILAGLFSMTVGFQTWGSQGSETTGLLLFVMFSLPGAYALRGAVLGALSARQSPAAPPAAATQSAAP